MSDLEKVTHTFISIHLHYCNSLYFGDLLNLSPACSECCAKAFNIIKKEWYCSNSPLPPSGLLLELSWKACFLSIKHWMAFPAYISELLSSYFAVRDLRSSDPPRTCLSLQSRSLHYSLALTALVVCSRVYLGLCVCCLWLVGRLSVCTLWTSDWILLSLFTLFLFVFVLQSILDQLC